MASSKRLLSPAVLYALGFGVPILITIGWLLFPLHLRVDPVARIALPFFVACVALPFAGAAWFRTDEAAREAHKVAAFWGMSFGLVAGLFALGLIVVASVPKEFAHAQLFMLLKGQIGEFAFPMMIGGMLVALIATAGYAVTWAVWWLRHR